MKFKNHYSRQRKQSNVGDPIKKIYQAEVDKKGVINLVEIGEENLYDFIQSHADSVNIHRIIERFSRGEVDVLSKVQGAFGDFTTLPTTYAELLNRVIQGENEFAKLPVEVKAKFNHSFADFLTNAGTDEWFEKLGMEKPNTPVDVPKVEDIDKKAEKEVKSE